MFNNSDLLRIMMFVVIFFPGTVFGHGTNSEPGSSFEKRQEETKKMYGSMVFAPYLKSLKFKILVEGCKDASPYTGKYLAREYDAYLSFNDNFITAAKSIIEQKGYENKTAEEFNRDMEHALKLSKQRLSQLLLNEAIPVCNYVLQELKAENYRSQRERERTSRKEPTPSELWAMYNMFTQKRNQRKNARCKAIEDCEEVIKNLVCEYWKFPKSDNDNVIIVNLTLEQNLLFAVSSISVAQSSGDSKLDRSLVNAIHAPAPYTELLGLDNKEAKHFRQLKLSFSNKKGKCSF